MLVVDAIKYREDMVRKAKTMVGDSAEDVVQGIVEYLIRKRMPGSKNAKSVLMWYVRNKCIEHIRNEKRKRKREISANDLDQESASEMINHPKKIDCVIDCLMEADPFIQELIILTAVDRVSIPEISRNTGISIIRLNYIAERVKKQIKNEYTEKERNGEEIF